MKPLSKICLLFITLLLSACNKSSFLDAKSKSNMSVPGTLRDFQSMLDYEGVMNITPGLGELSSDLYYLKDNFYNSTFTTVNKTLYIWKPDIYEGRQNIRDWNIIFQQLLTANAVLEGLEKLNPSSKELEQYQQIKGSALFFRAYAFFNFSQVFVPPYDSLNFTEKLGAPLKLTADVNDLPGRASIKQTYEQMISDLEASGELLPPQLDVNLRNRPSRTAAFALLSRIYLSMRAYPQAGMYAEKALQLYDVLIDYSTVPSSTVRYNPFPLLNAETILQSYLVSASDIYNPVSGTSDQAGIDSVLYNTYTANDLRKSVFFYKNTNKAASLNGTYYPGRQFFTGLATDELYLNKAECKARAGQYVEAITVLNKLLKKRFNSTFADYTASNQQEALDKILTERKKQLLFRGRWMDLRRLNKEGANITPSRFTNGQSYTLAPNSPLYTFPVPSDEIALSGIQQIQR